MAAHLWLCIAANELRLGRIGYWDMIIPIRDVDFKKRFGNIYVIYWEEIRGYIAEMLERNISWNITIIFSQCKLSEWKFDFLVVYKMVLKYSGNISCNNPVNH